MQAEFRYDGDGRRVQSVVNGVTTAFVGQYFEWTGSLSTMKKVYYFGAQRVAVRDGNGTGTTGLSWLLTDHLGSTTIALDAAGTKNAEKRYRPWGEERFSFGTLPTQYTYTGQYSHTAQFGLLFYNARWFDPLLIRFAQADSIIPGTGFSIAWDRYAGMANNPVMYADPSGHNPECGPDGAFCDGDVSNDLGYRTDITLDINIIGFAPDEMVSIWTSILEIASNLSKIMRQTPWEAFNSVFGGLNISESLDLGGWFGYHSGNSVKLLSGKVTPQLVSHELGHVFEKRVYNALGKGVSKAPANMLASSVTIKNSRGEHVTGNNGGNFERTMRGYRTCGYTCAYHPLDMMPDGNTPYEDFADMFMNWSFNSFDYTPEAYGAGTARYNWMNTNMSTWISYLP